MSLRHQIFMEMVFGDQVRIHYMRDSGKWLVEKHPEDDFDIEENYLPQGASMDLKSWGPDAYIVKIVEKK